MKINSHVRWVLILSFIVQTAWLIAEEPWRTWTSTAGTQIEAKLVKVEGSSITLLKKEGGQKIRLKLKQLSKADQDFIATAPEEPEEKGEISIEGIEAEPGRTSAEIQCRNNEKWSYFVYLPKDFHTGKEWPVWFIMSAGGGKGGRALKRYKAGADRLGCILALSVQSKNGFADSDLAIQAMADDVYMRFPVIESLGFSTGMSGGSRMAYLMAERDRRIAGVLACGSGSGVYLKEKRFRAAKLRKSTYIYSLIGTNCFNRAEAVTTHNKLPKDSRLRFFPGKHAWAGSPYIDEGMARVLGVALTRSNDNDLDKLKKSYAKTMWQWTLELNKKQPWEAAYWAKFLADFDGDSTIQREAEKLDLTLKSDPQVLLALKAEKAIDKLCQKHFNRYISQGEGKKSDPKREAEANKISEKYNDLPHAELIQKLAKPS